MTMRRILLIHTEMSVIRTLVRILEQGGYPVAVATEGDQGLQMARASHMQAVFLGIQCSALKGFDMLQQLKRRGVTRGVPVILLLEEFDEALAVQGLKMGAVDFLVCPFDEADVRRRVGVWARMHAPEKGWRSQLFRYRQKLPALVAGRYEKIKRLGLGSYGEVWKIRDIEALREDAFYVAKIPASKKLNHLFRAEAAICQKLEDHPNVVKIIDVVEDQGRSVLIQDYVAGRTLKDLLERPLENGERVSIVSQLVDIVAHAHRHWIVHRDIKPENVFVGFDGRVKLLDYGIARELKKGEISRTMVGSRPFMAPEQILGKSQIASDVWALGVVLYEMFTGFLPFYDENEKALIDIILTREPEAPRKLKSDLPVELEQVILRCLKKDPGERFSDAGALQEALTERVPGFVKQ